MYPCKHYKYIINTSPPRARLLCHIDSVSVFSVVVAAAAAAVVGRSLALVY